MTRILTIAFLAALALSGPARADEPRPYNTQEDIALRERLAAEADAKKRANPAPPSRSGISGNPYRATLGKDAGDHLLMELCKARHEC